VGATLVRHSDPASEVAETHAKAAGVLAAIGAIPARAPRAGGGTPLLAENHRVQAALDARRGNLSPFWLRMQSPALTGDATGEGPHCLVVDCEDTFTSMLAHLLRSLGHRVTVRRWDLPGLNEAVAAHDGPLVLGPGPGDPTADEPKMNAVRGLIARHLTDPRPGGLLAVCLSHQLLCEALGLPLLRLTAPHQGAQESIDLFGARQTVGFYNTFTAHCDDAEAHRLALTRGVRLSRDPQTGHIHALRAPGLASVQFHPESVLTLDGVGIVRDLVASLDAAPADQSSSPASMA
jgi:phenazine biosynthesis protein phzE